MQKTKKEFDNISLKKLKIWSEVNVRKTDAYVGIEDLKDNIKQIGIQAPLVVVPHKKNYRIISGQRRFIAAGKAGLTTVPCYIKYNLSPLDATIASFSENVFREDMTDDDKSNAAAFLKDKLGGVNEVAEKMGVSTQTVYNYLNWRRVFPSLRKLVREHKITPELQKKLIFNSIQACTVNLTVSSSHKTNLLPSIVPSLFRRIIQRYRIVGLEKNTIASPIALFLCVYKRKLINNVHFKIFLNVVNCKYLYTITRSEL